jgi:hypothetical protein
VVWAGAAEVRAAINAGSLNKLIIASDNALLTLSFACVPSINAVLNELMPFIPNFA